jgi:hypothetical protein
LECSRLVENKQIINKIKSKQTNKMATATIKNVKFTPSQIKALDEHFTEKTKDLLDKLVSNDDGYDEDEMRDLIAERFNTLEFKRMKESDMNKSLGKGNGDNSDDSDNTTKKGKGGKGKTGKSKTGKGSKSKNDDSGKTKVKKTDGFKLFMWGENKDGEVSKLKATDDFKEQVESEGIESRKVHPFAVKLASAKWSDMTDDEKKVYQDRAVEINDLNAEAHNNAEDKSNANGEDGSDNGSD